MQESFLHYVWQLQYFNKQELQTTQGEPLEIFETGSLNSDAGPDFLNSKVRIGSVNWAGNVEIHTKASHWQEHMHDEDPAYDNVILHVVWEEDKPVVRSDGSSIPTIALQDRVAPDLVDRYNELVNNFSVVPCDKSFEGVDDLIKLSMIEKALMQRLEVKASQILQLLDHVTGDWEDVTYQLMARNFGFKINQAPFFQLSQALSRKILLKHADNLTHLEALLFGQAGFLDYKIKDEYVVTLHDNYKVLSAKYNLASMKLNYSQWKFLRLRPANFPTIRLAQFGALFFKHANLFDKILEVKDLDELQSVFAVNTSNYWHKHYRFGRPTTQSLARLGKESLENIVINTVVPLLVAYGRKTDDQSLVDRAVQFLEKTSSEKNKIVKSWKEMGYKARNAFDSQGLIELNNSFCLKRKCLSCAIGTSLLKPTVS